MMMNQKTGVMLVSGIVAAVTSLVFTGSAMGLLGVKKAPSATLDPTVAGQQPTPPAKKTVKKDTDKDAEETAVEQNL